jgi:hypothetical protein
MLGLVARDLDTAIMYSERLLFIKDGVAEKIPPPPVPEVTAMAEVINKSSNILSEKS